jgi:acyl-CoA synthetase (AMP-forming)/AMP-acid ligase II
MPVELRDEVTSPERRAAYERAGLWDASTLGGRAAAHALADADAIAVVDREGGRRRTRGELARDAARIAGGLARAGIGPGDVVSVQLPNVYEAVVAALAIAGRGAVLNPLLPNYRQRELEHVFRTAAPRAIFTPAEYRGFDHRALIAEVARRTGHAPCHVVVDGDGGSASWDAWLEAAPAALEPAPARAVSELIFTSGTEAQPKAIMHTEQTANFSMRVALADMRLSAQDVVWMPSPVGHSTGFNYGLRFALYHGLRLVLQDRWQPELACKLVQQEGCSYTLAATTFLQDLLDEVSRSGADLRSLRCFGCGGAPVPAELVRAAARAGIGVRRLYGSTEVLVATWNRADSPAQASAETDGRAMDHVEVEIRDEAGARCAADIAGEIFVRGPNTCVGFYADPERTHQTFDAQGWMRSGDLGVQDASGHLSVVGRKKEIIIRGGINIAPREIEDLLLEFPEVERAAVVGLPDPRLGERCCACLVLRPGQCLDLATLVTRLRGAGLATYKLPERLELLDALPTTASGKIQKHRLVAELGGAAR